MHESDPCGIAMMHLAEVNSIPEGPKIPIKNGWMGQPRIVGEIYIIGHEQTQQQSQYRAINAL